MQTNILLTILQTSYSLKNIFCLRNHVFQNTYFKFQLIHNKFYNLYVTMYYFTSRLTINLMQYIYYCLIININNLNFYIYTY